MLNSLIITIKLLINAIYKITKIYWIKTKKKLLKKKKKDLKFEFLIKRDCIFLKNFERINKECLNELSPHFIFKMKLTGFSI